MAEQKFDPLDDPAPRRRGRLRNPLRGDAFGRGAEAFARMMGTPAFLVGMTLFCAVWLTWNSLAPESAQFDPRALNFTLLTLILSLQASYAAPLLLLAQNRQDDRDKVALREDRARAERNLADTEYLTRELAGLRIALQDVATRDFVRSEMRDAVAEITQDLKQELREQVRAELLEELGHAPAPEPRPAVPGGVHRKKKKKKNRPSREARERIEGGEDGTQGTTLAELAAEQAGEGPSDQAHDQAHDQSHDQAHEQAHHQSREQARDRTHDQTNEDHGTV